MKPGRQPRRSREGCWTCRKRRKKCDGSSVPCNNCQRLGLDCERGTRLVWEDDVRRHGMRKRGPPSRKHNNDVSQETGSYHVTASSPPSSSAWPSSPSFRHISRRSDSAHDQLVLSWDTRLVPQVSDWPFELDTTDCQLLDRYIQLFSKTYPTCTDTTNPFVRVFLPLATQSRPILDAMLALSCVQSWENSNFTMEIPMLRYRTSAIRGCQGLVADVLRKWTGQHEVPWSSCPSNEDHVNAADTTAPIYDDANTQLLAVCVLLMLYEKLTGERQANGSTHLQLFARIFPGRLFVTVLQGLIQEAEVAHPSEAILFLSNIFLYNDLVRSTSLRTSTLSNIYLCEGSDFLSTPPTEEVKERFYFPRIIARIGAEDGSVTDDEIAAWNGRLDWLPSFALQPPKKDEQRNQLPTADVGVVFNPIFEKIDSFTCSRTWGEATLTSELYRVAATVYRKQCQPDNPDRGMGNLPFWAVSLLRLLPPGSRYDTALLWPVAIIAKELTDCHEREYVLYRLEMLEQRLKLKNYCVVREHLVKMWNSRDIGYFYENMEASLFG